MKIICTGWKRTAFTLEKSSIDDKVIIYSDKTYETAGYKIKFDGNLNFYTLEIIVKSVNPPKGPAFKNDAPASAYLFSTYIKSSKLYYDHKNRLIRGPPGAKLQVILRDECRNKGYTDFYELTF